MKHPRQDLYGVPSKPRTDDSIVAGSGSLTEARAVGMWRSNSGHTNLLQVLEDHGPRISDLAKRVTDLEREWLEFVATAQAAHLPVALGLIERLDRLRRRMVGEAIQIAALVRELDERHSRITVKDSAVLLAPVCRRTSEAE